MVVLMKMKLFTLWYIRLLIFSRNYNKAINKCLILIRDRNTSVTVRQKAYYFLALLMDEIKLNTYRELYQYFKRDKETLIDLDNNIAFMMFSFLFNFQMYSNFDHVDLGEKREYFRDEASNYYDRLLRYHLNYLREASVRTFHFILMVSEKQYKYAIELNEAIFDTFGKKLDREMENVLLLYKAVCYLELDNDELALQIFESLKGCFDSNRIKDIYHLNTLYKGLGDIYKKRNQTKKAKDYYMQGLKIVKGVDFEEHVKEMQDGFHAKLKGLDGDFI